MSSSRPRCTLGSCSSSSSDSRGLVGSKWTRHSARSQVQRARPGLSQRKAKCQFTAWGAGGEREKRKDKNAACDNTSSGRMGLEAGASTG